MNRMCSGGEKTAFTPALNIRVRSVDASEPTYTPELSPTLLTAT